MICKKCSRVNKQKLAACPVCGGEMLPTRHAVDRVAFGKRRATCQACMYYGAFKGRRGCGMLAVPCRCETLWTVPREAWCPMGFHSE